MDGKSEEKNYIQELTTKDLGDMRGLAVVEIYRPDCEPCSQLEPVLKEVSQNYAGKISFYKSHFVRGGLGQHFGLNIEHVPTIVLLKDGQIVQHFTGARYADKTGKNRTAAKPEFLINRLDDFIKRYQQQIQTNTTETTSTNQYPTRDLETKLDLSENSLTTLKERYLKKDEQRRIIERPEDMFRRVADNIAQAESFYGASEEEVKKTADDFYELMANLKFMPNSPTLMNAGRDLQQLSACFVLPVADSIERIFEAAKEGALVHKSGGGTGYSLSRLRPEGSRVKTTNGVASGPVSFFYIFNVYTEAVKQGGTRRGANMGMLSVDHPNIRKFIHAKGVLNYLNREIVDGIKEEIGLEENDPYIACLKRKLLEKTQLNNLNLSAGVIEGFMEAEKADGYFDLRDPHTGEVVERVKARELLEEIVDQAYRTGDPGIVFLDRINEHNPTPHIGRIEATNPCGEQPLLPYESCNLGSINLSKFVRNREIDREALRDTVHKAVRFLDNVIDMNKYPLPQIEEMTKANRKIGLGVMGFADMLTMLRIPYGSEESYALAREVMKLIRDEARKTSINLAEKRGVFPNWEGSIYDPNSQYFKGEELRLRNATTTTNAPTGSIAQIVDCEWGIESAFSLAYTKTVMDGKVLHYRARGFERILKEEGYNAEEIFGELEQGRRDKFEKLPSHIKELARTSMRLTPEQHIRVQAAFQEFTDNAISKTINFPAEATREDIKKAFILAYELGCKGLTIYRDKSKDEQVLEEKVEEKYDFGSKLPKEVLSITREEMVGDRKRIFVTVGYWENPRNQREIERLKREGRPTQFFIDANFFDPKTQSLITALAIRGSKDLRRGIPVEEITDDLRDLPSADEVGYDGGFGPGKEYVNKSVPDGIWKALSGWKPPATISEQNVVKEGKREKAKEEKQNNQAPNQNGFALCPKCSRYGVVHQDGCDKCISCGYSQKGCFS